VVRVFSAFALLFLFLLGVNLLGDGFEGLGGDLLDSFFRATTNPFIGLVVGLFATSLVQSSSVTTSLIVGMVAAPENPLPVANAVPMVMGANIGTTVTNAIVAMAHMENREEFRRAFAVATCHDFFNLMAVAVLLPLEIGTGFLRHSAEWIAAHATGLGGVTYSSPIKVAIGAVAGPMRNLIGLLTASEQIAGIIVILVSGVMIYVALILLVRTLRSLWRKRLEGAVAGSFGNRPLTAMASGMIVTAMVQSSSITTSLLVPLGGAGVITLAQAFPVTIGANLGTTVTALLASLGVTGVNASAGVTIALVHLLFNLTATVLIYPVKRIRQLPLWAAAWLAETASRSRLVALAFVIGQFYLLPGLLAYLTRN